MFRLFRDLYLSGEPNNCFDRAAQGHQSKCNWRNTATVLKTLVKSHKCLKKQNHSPKTALVNNRSDKFSQTSHEGTFREAFS